MPVVEIQRSVTAHAGLVWDVVTDLANEAALPPTAKRVEVTGEAGVGLQRRIIGADGHAWSEQCTDWQEQQRYTMTVATDEFPVPCAALRYTCAIVPDEQHKTVLVRFYLDYRNRFGLFGSIFERYSGRRRLLSYAHQQMDKWISLIHGREWAYGMTAAALLNDKGRELYAVSPTASVAEAAAILRDKRCGSVMVLQDEQLIAGMVTERDIVRGLVDDGAALLEKPVSMIMTREVITAQPTDNMMLIMSSMSDNRIRHLPVIEAGVPVGVISIGDVVKARINELEGQSETLRDYIEARHWHELYQEIGPAAYTDTIAGVKAVEVQEQI